MDLFTSVLLLYHIQNQEDQWILPDQSDILSLISVILLRDKVLILVPELPMQMSECLIQLIRK